MRGLIFDPFAGISGDMTVGALLELAGTDDPEDAPGGELPPSIAALLEAPALEGVTARIEGVRRAGIAATRFVVEGPGEEAHRSLADVLGVVDGLPLAGRARERVRTAFRSLAGAEAKVHGTAPEAAHFHEVGALDAVVDIAAAMATVELLGVERIWTRPVAVGEGTAEMVHGRYPLPAPATLELLRGLPVRSYAGEGERTTPTGAAILRTLVSGGEPPGRFDPLDVGYGAGSRDDPGGPNVLRIFRAVVAPEGEGETLVLVQADVDDQDPEYVPAVRERLGDAGAVDVTTTAVGMKKGRPGLRIEALVPESRLHETVDALLRETSTIGVRHWPVGRRSLPRTIETLDWEGRTIRVKRSVLPDGHIRRKPEYEDVVAAARELGRGIRETLAAIEDRLRERREAPGSESDATDGATNGTQERPNDNRRMEG